MRTWRHQVLAVIVPNLFPSSDLRGSTSFDVPSYDLEQAAWSRFELSGCGFPKNKSSGCGTVEKYLSPSTRLCRVCLLSATLDSKPSICSVSVSIFSITWGVYFSLKANPNRRNE